MNLKLLSNELHKYQVILKPDKDEPDWWAGAPSVLLTKEGKFYLAARMREANAPRGRRGYEIRLLESQDGLKFKTIRSLNRDDTPLIKGFERPALVFDEKTCKYRLYGCGEFENGWGIWKLDDVSDPKDFDLQTLKPILKPEYPPHVVFGASPHHSTTPIQYKDPFIIFLGGFWWMFVIGFDRIERAYIFRSIDGENWKIWGDQGRPIMENDNWHNFYTRPACLIPLRIGYILVYEGSNISWFDPGYNIASGLAFSTDLIEFVDLTKKEPIFVSNPGLSARDTYISWRYSHWIKKDDIFYIYFEAANLNHSNEIRCAIINSEISQWDFI